MYVSYTWLRTSPCFHICTWFTSLPVVLSCHLVTLTNPFLLLIILFYFLPCPHPMPPLQFVCWNGGAFYHWRCQPFPQQPLITSRNPGRGRSWVPLRSIARCWLIQPCVSDHSCRAFKSVAAVPCLEVSVLTTSAPSSSYVLSSLASVVSPGPRRRWYRCLTYEWAFSCVFILTLASYKSLQSPVGAATSSFWSKPATALMHGYKCGYWRAIW